MLFLVVSVGARILVAIAVLLASWDFSLLLAFAIKS